MFSPRVTLRDRDPKVRRGRSGPKEVCSSRREETDEGPETRTRDLWSMLYGSFIDSTIEGSRREVWVSGGPFVGISGSVGGNLTDNPRGLWSCVLKAESKEE